MPTLDERIAMREKRIAEEKAELAKLRKQRTEHKRRERRENERRERLAEQRNAVELWRWLHDHSIRLKDGTVWNCYDFVTHVMAESVADKPDDD